MLRFVIAVIAAVLVLPVPALALTPPVTYTPPQVVIARGLTIDQAAVERHVARLANDPRGWRQDLGHITVAIGPAGFWGTAHGQYGTIGRALPDRDAVYITADGWTMPHHEVPLSQVRTWIVLHEIGHLLGHEHTDCPGSGAAPVMRPWLVIIGDCTPNIWPNPAGAADGGAD